jgi:hypothetical protein
MNFGFTMLKRPIQRFGLIKELALMQDYAGQRRVEFAHCGGIGRWGQSKTL